MQILNAVDLDKTLLKIFSPAYLAFHYFNPVFFVYALLEGAGVYDLEQSVRAVYEKLRPVLADEEAMRRFSRFLLTKIDPGIVEKVREESGPDTTTVVISASPESYVHTLAALLGYEGIGSHWKGEDFFFCYGRNKLIYLEQKFPPDRYKYHCAISNSLSDLELLSHFEKKMLC